MAWKPVVEKLKEALTWGSWAAAETQIDLLSKTDHPPDIFRNLLLNGQPALQHLAYIFPRGMSIDRMTKVVKCLTDSGYDINQQSGLRAPRGITALLAAVASRNPNLVTSLLRQGARTDIRDPRGNSPLHWALFGGCRDIFDLLLEFGASVTSSEGEKSGEEGKAHPLLHTAVDRGDHRMVSFMLRKGIFDVNEKALYPGNGPWTTAGTFSPLGRAILQRDAKIFWNLLDQPGIRAELDELHLCLVKEDEKMASAVMGHLSDLCWVTISDVEGAGEERVPSLLWLLHKVCSGLSFPEGIISRLVSLPTLATVMKQFVDHGYDLSQTWSATPGTSPVVREPLLHYVLRIDMNGRTNLLLQTLIQLDQWLVPVTSVEGRKCLEYLLRIWTDSCLASEGTECWRPEPSGERVTCCVDAVKTLLSQGLNVSGVVIRKEFRYHFGYKPMIQLLHRNGAKVDDDFFSADTICSPGNPNSEEMDKELGQLKEIFDQDNPISLKDICRLRIRKMLTGSEELVMLKGVPAELKEFVLRNKMD